MQSAPLEPKLSVTQNRTPARAPTPASLRPPAAAAPFELNSIASRSSPRPRPPGARGWTRARARAQSPSTDGPAGPVAPTVLVNAAFAGAVYGAARHGGARDVALVAADYCVTYYVLAAICFCVWKLELLRRQRDDPESAAQRRRVSFAAWAVSVALGVNIAMRVADATVRYDHLALKIAVWVLAGVATGVAGYFFFFGHPRADAGRRPEEEEALHVRVVSVEQKRVCEV